MPRPQSDRDGDRLAPWSSSKRPNPIRARVRWMLRLLCVCPQAVRGYRRRRTYLMLSAANRRATTKYAFGELSRIDFANLPNTAKSLFRFEEPDLERLAVALRLPERILTKNRDVATRKEALAIVLRRLAYPSRWCDLVPLFGRQVGPLSSLFNTTVGLIHRQWHANLESFDTTRLRDRVVAFAARLRLMGCPLPNIFAFIDGTLRPIARSRLALLSLRSSRN